MERVCHHHQCWKIVATAVDATLSDTFSLRLIEFCV